MTVIRPATPDDAEGVAAVHVQGWREAYPGMLPQDVLDRWGERVSVERWRQTLGNPDVSAWLAVDGDRVVGFATAGRAFDDDAPVPRQLWALYILREFYDRGVGWRLLDAVLATDEPVYLWVLKANDRARRFYGRQGFRPDGTEKQFDEHVIDGAPVLEIRMVRSVRQPPGSPHPA